MCVCIYIYRDYIYKYTYTRGRSFARVRSWNLFPYRGIRVEPLAYASAVPIVIFTPPDLSLPAGKKGGGRSGQRGCVKQSWNVQRVAVLCGVLFLLLLSLLLLLLLSGHAGVLSCREGGGKGSTRGRSLSRFSIVLPDVGENQTRTVFPLSLSLEETASLQGEKSDRWGGDGREGGRLRACATEQRAPSESRYLSGGPPVIGGAITIILIFSPGPARGDRLLSLSLFFVFVFFFVAKAKLIDLLIYVAPLCAPLPSGFHFYAAPAGDISLSRETARSAFGRSAGVDDKSSVRACVYACMRVRGRA